jgi:DNA topoisomerase-2
MSTDDNSLAKQYQRKTDKQHILDNPDTYIGSVENVDANLWVYDDNENKMTHKTIEYIPGLYKLFDEGIVNARDHVIRMINSPILDKKFVSQINITIENDKITLFNDGNGIDVAKHPEYDIWIPEMIFGHLRTSTNYNKDEKRIVGGKNGFGFKLVLIWSTYGYIETVDHIRGLKYTQEFKDNLDVLCPPKITKCKTSKPYTKVCFVPDYKRFGIDGITSDMMALLKKRVYDIAAVTDHSIKKIKVNFNDTMVPVKNFQNYIDLFIGGKGDNKRIYETTDERWEYAVALSPTQEFMQVSFVNGICTSRGGKHVDYITNQLTRKLVDYIEKKKKVKVNANAIKEQLILFLRCDIENPAFDSQTKDYMNTPASKFGSTCSISDGFIDKVAKMGVMDTACSISEIKDMKAAKKTDGSKTKTIRGINNLIDANLAGTVKSKDCILILCEGLSAMSGIVSGLSSDDRNTMGIYPLKGKLLNVRGEQIKKINDNKEISDIKKVLGLESGKTYESLDDVYKYLRYGKILILCDQDTDGSHIKGLCINLFHSEWSSLVQIKGFLSYMNTPILRAKKGNVTKLFYNDGEYNDWKSSINNNTSGWKIKYFKGLGTSTSIEFKEYFANKKIVEFVYTGPESDDMIDKVFNKKRSDDRKKWLGQYDKEAFLNTEMTAVNYEDFINKELIHFSTYDCGRSIPSVVDGLKTSQRKIIYCAFKRKLLSEIKVAQFSGYVSEHSCYHHGEASLNGAIINMAQNFVGSNNINYLSPNGQFGTRLHGGSDSASERYIFTQIEPITRHIFHEADDHILKYLDDDGIGVEPEYYVPIIPTVLLNGVSGIGTGFSSTIPPFDAKTIIDYMMRRLNDDNPESVKFVPHYEGFRGTIKSCDEDNRKFLIKGIYKRESDDTVVIYELPIGTWTMPYVSFLETLLDNVDKNGKKKTPAIKDFTSLSTESFVKINVVFPKGKLDELEKSVDEFGVNGVEKLLKLTATTNINNMHLFDPKGRLRKYDLVTDICEEFLVTRIHFYQIRKTFLIDVLKKRLLKMVNKANFIMQILHDQLDLRGKNNDQVIQILEEEKYDRIDGDYKYLIKMPMDSVTEESIESIMCERQELEDELKLLSDLTPQRMWYSELETLKIHIIRYKVTRQNKLMSSNKEEENKKKKRANRKITDKRNMLVDTDLIEIQDITVNEAHEELTNDLQRVNVEYVVPENAPKVAQHHTTAAEDSIVVEEIEEDEQVSPIVEQKKTSKQTSKQTSEPKKRGRKKKESK